MDEQKKLAARAELAKMEASRGAGSAEPVIDEGESRSLPRKSIEFILTCLGTAVMWLALAVYVYQRIFAAGDDRAFAIFILLAFITFAIIIVQGGWQLYNWWRFHGKDRRREFPMQPLAVVGDLYGIEECDMETLQDIRQAAVIRFADSKYYYVVENHEPIEIMSLRGH